MTRRSRSPLVPTLLAGMMACSNSSPTGGGGHFTASELEALPRLQLAEGPRVCEATGRDPCPFQRAFANWIGPDRYALWEPGREVLVFDARHPEGLAIGRIGTGPGEYANVLAVGTSRSRIAVIDGWRKVLIQLSDRGEFKSEAAIQPPSLEASPGFSGESPVIQSVIARDTVSPATFRVFLARSAGAEDGRVLLEEPVPWLTLRNGEPAAPVPLFAAYPSYAVDRDQSVVWGSPGGFQIQRRDRKGAVRWTLTSDRPPFPVTAEDIEGRRRELLAQVQDPKAAAATIDSMVAVTGEVHPAMGVIVLQPGGKILVGDPLIPSRDSVAYFVLSQAGAPEGRLSLPARTRVLLFAGDSLLVHRPTDGEPWEVRWLRLRH